jgi:N6-adenosine-specific RNA methylase IME4
MIGYNKDFPIGQGHTTRKQGELCLLTRRGRFGRQDEDVPQLIFAPSRENSQKPEEQYGLIERLVRGPYPEFFARQRLPGWDQVYSLDADTGPGKRRWRADSYPEAAP